MFLRRKVVLILLVLTAFASPALAQGVQLNEYIVINKPDLKAGVKPEAFQSFLGKVRASSGNQKKQADGYHLFKADRGDDKGGLLLLSIPKDRNARVSNGGPFTDKAFTSQEAGQKLSDFVTNPGVYTEYQLIGADQFKTLPEIGILGIHYIKVKKEKTREFEKFTEQKMHPAVGEILPDMHLLTYKAIGGENAGSYITIFAIASVEARDKYWPAGKPETAILKEAFQPHKDLAQALSGYLVEGSYLEPAGGAAAIFESREWTDFIYQRF
jgi:hypothetical protein